MFRLVGCGCVLEIILGSDDLDVEIVEKWGYFNWVFFVEYIEFFVDVFVKWIVLFFVEVIVFVKEVVDSVEKDIEEGFKDEVFNF